MDIYKLFLKYILVITSVGFITPLFLTTNPFFIFLFIIISFVSSVFWIEKKQHSINHKIDAIMSRVGIISVIYYKLFVNTSHLFLFSVSAIIMFFFRYLSDVASRKKWLSEKHILYHMICHIFLILCGIIAFDNTGIIFHPL